MPNFSRAQARGTDHTDAKVNALARHLLQQTSARNTDSSTISPGSELNLKGDIRITDQGEIQVITREPNGAGGFNDVIAHIGNTSIDTHSALSQSPAIWFTSSVDTPQGPRAIPARISSNRGRGIVLESPTDDSSYGQQAAIGIEQWRAHAYASDASNPDGSASGGSASMQVAASSLELIAKRASTGTESVNSVGVKAGLYSETYGTIPELEFMAGHVSTNQFRARLRTRGAGEFWLESVKPDNTVLGQVYTTGDGKVRIRASVSVELESPTNITALFSAQTITASTITVTGTIEAATLKATGQVQGASAAFTGDVAAATFNGNPLPAHGSAQAISYTNANPLDGVSPKVRWMIGGGVLQFDGGLSFTSTRAAYAVLCTLPSAYWPPSIKNIGLVSSAGWITAQIRTDGTIITGTAFTSGGWLALSSMAPVPITFP